MIDLPEIIVDPWNNELIFNYEDVAWVESLEGGIKCYFDNIVVAQLLLARQLHLNDLPCRDGMRTTCFYVDCSDVFAWGSADSEPVAWGEEEGSELTGLYEEWHANHRWGATRWCIKKRSIRPMYAVVLQLKDAGLWDDLPALKPNPYEERVFSKKDPMYNKIVLGYQEEDVYHE